MPAAAAQPQAGTGDVLASIRRMIAEDGHDGAPAAPPLRLDASTAVRHAGPAPMPLGASEAPEAARLRAAALREAIRARAAEAEISVTAQSTAAAAKEEVAAAEATPVAVSAIDPASAGEHAAAPAPPPVLTATEAPAVPIEIPATLSAPAEAPASAAGGFFGEMIREVLRQELRGDGLDRMAGDLRAMVLREVARAITGGRGGDAGRM